MVTPNYSFPLVARGEGASTGNPWDDDLNLGIFTPLDTMLYAAVLKVGLNDIHLVPSAAETYTLCELVEGVNMTITANPVNGQITFDASGAGVAWGVTGDIAEIGTANDGGVLALATRADHVHKGLHQVDEITLGQGDIFGDIAFVAGTNIGLTQVGNSITIDASGIGVRTYDAIVAAAGGDYTTLGAAITAGKKSIFVKQGTYTETGHVILTDQLISGEGYNTIIDFGSAYYFSVGAKSIISNLTLKTQYDGLFIRIAGDDVLFDNVAFDSYHTSNPAAVSPLVGDNNIARNRIRFVNCYYHLAGYSNIRAALFNHPNTRVSMVNTEIVPDTDTYSYLILSNGYLKITNFKGEALLTNRYNIDANVLYLSNAEAFFVKTTGVSFINNSTLALRAEDEVFVSSSNIELILASGSDSSKFSSCLITSLSDSAVNNISFNACEFTGATTFSGNVRSLSACMFAAAVISNGSMFKASDCQMDVSLAINGNNTSFLGGRVGAIAGGGAGTITVNVASTGIVILGTHTDASIVDNSGVADIAHTVVY